MGVFATQCIAALYSDLMNKRQESDYNDFFEFAKADIIPLIDEVKEFVGYNGRRTDDTPSICL
jgi:hypothetical protein